MHREFFHFVSNTFLLVILLTMLIIPISTVTIMRYDPGIVLSAQEDRSNIQIPREQIIRNNAIKLTEEKQNIRYDNVIEETPETTTTPYLYQIP